MRAESAEETRRVLDAMYAALRSAPAQPVSVDRVARDAGVARSTVYLVFGYRAELFDALAADLAERSAIRRIEDGRRAATVQLAERLAAQGALRDGVGVDDAVDVLWLLGGFDGFDELHTGRGLSAERTADVLLGLAERALLREPG